MNRLKEKYEKTIVSDLMSKHNYKNVMELLGKDKLLDSSNIAVSMSVSEKYLEAIYENSDKN